MTRALFIGLDGATFTVLRRLMDGEPHHGVTMPFLRSLFANGAHAKLRSTPNPLTPPAWVSLMTGRTPGYHGVYDFMRAEERDGEVYFTLSDSRDVRVETIWSIASRHRRKVVSLNFPITAPPRPLNGALVPGFVPWKHLRRNVTPPELFDRLRQTPGFSAKELAWDFDMERQATDELDAAGVEAWIGYHLVREAQWFRIAEKLLVEDRPDLMAVMFDGTDKIQHQAWIFLDPAFDAAAESAEAARTAALCRQYFREVDSYIERLYALAGPGAQVFLASDHGFTGSTHIVRINTILHDLGYLAWRPRDGSAQSQRRERSWFANLDWSKTVAYCRTPSSNGVTIRIAERPGLPGVSPDLYEPFREKLMRQLLDIRDEESGQPVFASVRRREEAFPGPAMRDAPDLLLTLHDHGFVSIADGHPAVVRRPVPVGTHHPDGILIAHGPGIRRGVELERRNIVDVAALLLYSIDAPVPADLEGVVPETMFTDDHLTSHPVRLGSPTLPVRDGEVQEGDMADAEKEKIIKQLQLLGYME
jgi:predicted AlkP superfamily phosphohydrolase/phosphomutase